MGSRGGRPTKLHSAKRLGCAGTQLLSLWRAGPVHGRVDLHRPGRLEVGPEFARVMVRIHPLAQRHLHLVHGLPALADPLEFADVFAREKSRELSAALSAVKPASGLKRPSRRAATKKLELW